MTDSRQPYDEQLPWLEAVDDEAGSSGIPARRMLAALLVVLLAVAVVSGTFFWLGRQNGSGETGGAPELIKAEATPYKVKPTDPGGLDVAGESETAFETSAGQDTDAQLDMSRAPEPPPPAPPKPGTAQPGFSTNTPKPAVEPAPAETAEAQPTGAKGSVIQLGAFANRAQAERAWTSLAGRFPSVASMNKMIVPFSGGIRLRASASSPADAKAACQALKAGGENCFVAN